MWKDYFVYTFYKSLAEDNSVARTAGLTVNPISIRILDDFELYYISHTNANSGGNNLIDVTIENYSSGTHYITPKTVALPCISGNSVIGSHSNLFKPYILPKPVFLKKGSVLVIEASDTSDSDNYLRMAFHGCKFIKGDAPYEKNEVGEFEIKGFLEGASVANADALNTNVATVKSIEFEQGSDFLIKQLVCNSTGTFICNITDEYGNNWFNRPIHSGNLFGDGSFPNNLLCSKYIKGGTKLLISLQNTHTTYNSINIGLIGHHVNIIK